MIKVIMFDLQANKVVFKGTFDHVELAHRDASHPLYPEKQNRNPLPEEGVLASEKGEYIAILTKENSDAMEHEPSSYDEETAETSDAESEEGSGDFLYPFGRPTW